MSEVWTEAVASLDEDVKSGLNIFSSTGNSSVNDVISLVNKRKEDCVKARLRWKKSSGEVIVIRDVMEKIAVWLEKLRKIGDVAVQVDQTSTALPWAGFRYLLQVTISDIKNFGTVSEGIEFVTRQLLRCAVMEPIILNNPSSHASLKAEFRQALVSFYGTVLIYLSKSAKYYASSTRKRVTSALLLIDESFDEHLLEVRSKADAVCVMISHITASSVGEIHQMIAKIQDISQSIETPIIRTYEVIDKISASMKREEYLRILNWTSTVPFWTSYEDNVSDLVPGTGAWLQEQPVYQNWQRSSTSSIFWLRGSVGSGKTKLSTTLIRSALGRLDANTNLTPIAYFYCCRTNGDTRFSEPDHVIRSVLRQVAVSRLDHTIHQSLQQKNTSKRESAEKLGIDPAPLSAKECLDVLTSVAHTRPLFIIIDALDEIRNTISRNMLIDFLQKLIQDSSCVVKIFISSRPMVASGLESTHTTVFDLEPSHTAMDIQTFLRERVHEAQVKRNLLRGLASEDLKSSIVRRLYEQAAGMFLLAKLQFDRICDSTQIKMEDDILEILNSRASSIDGVLQNIVDQIDKYSRHARAVTHLVFSLLLSAEQPLTIDDVISAVSSGSGNKASLSLEAVLDLCGNLVSYSVQNCTLQFIHVSIQDYLSERPEFSITKIHFASLKSCLQVYLSEDDFETLDERSQKDETESPIMVSKSFQAYAASFWPHHLKKIEDPAESQEAKEIVLKFALSENYIYWDSWLTDVDHLCQNHNLRDPVYQKLHAVLSESGSILFAACIFGITPLWDAYIQTTAGARLIANTALTNSEGAGLLYLACRNGNSREVESLLTSGMPPNISGGFYGNPLYAAAFLGYSDIVKILLDAGADTVAHGKFHDALQAAFAGGFESVVLILVERPFNHYMSIEEVLKAASLHGFHNVVEKIMLNDSTDPVKEIQVMLSLDSVITELQTSLFEGRTRIARSWLKKLVKIADINVQGGPYGNALQAAAFGGNMSCLELVLETGASLKLKGFYGSALRAAALNGHDTTISLLLAKGACIEDGVDPYSIRDLSFRMDVSGTQHFAVTAAAMNNHHSTVELLCDSIGESNYKEAVYAEALGAASARGNDSIVKLLLDWTNTSNYSSIEHYALNEAMFAGKISTVELFLDRFTNIVPSSQIMTMGLTMPGAISIASLVTGTNQYPSGGISIPPKYSDGLIHKRHGGGLLRAAARIGNHEIIERLLERGASPDGAEDRVDDYSIPRPIEVAAAHGHATAVQSFLRLGANIGRALCFAVRYRHEDVVRTILNYLPDMEVDMINFTGTTLKAISANSQLMDNSALALAWYFGFGGILDLLLEHKAKCETNKLPNLTFVLAAFKNDTVMINLFLNDQRFWPDVPEKACIFTWAAVAAVTNGHRSFVDEISHLVSPAGFDTRIVTQLINRNIQTEKYDIFDLVQLFIKHEHSPLKEFTLLGIALEALIEKQRQIESHRTLRYLRQPTPDTIHKIDQNITSLSQYFIAKTQNHIISKEGTKFLVNMIEVSIDNEILTVGEMILQKFQQQKNVLSSAKSLYPKLTRILKSNDFRQFEAVFHFSKILHSHGADPNGRDDDGRTAMFEACLKKNFQMIILLMDLGASIYDVYPLSDFPEAFFNSLALDQQLSTTFPDSANILYITIGTLLSSVGSKTLLNVSPIPSLFAGLISRLLHTDLSMDPDSPEFITLLQIATYQNVSEILEPMKSRMIRHCLLHGRDLVTMLDQVAMVHVEALAGRKESVKDLVAIGLSLNQGSCVLPLFNERLFTAISIQTHAYAMMDFSTITRRGHLTGRFRSENYLLEFAEQGRKTAPGEFREVAVRERCSLLLQLINLSPHPYHWLAAFSFTAITGQKDLNLIVCRNYPNVEEAEMQFPWIDMVIDRGHTDIFYNLRSQKLLIPLTTYKRTPILCKAFATENRDLVSLLFEEQKYYSQLDKDLLSAYLAERMDITKIEQIQQNEFDVNTLFCFEHDFYSIIYKRNFLSIVCDGSLYPYSTHHEEPWMENRTKLLRDLLLRGADPVCPGLLNTAIGHLLSSNGLDEVEEIMTLAEILISHGADLNEAKGVLLDGSIVRDYPVHQFIRASTSNARSLELLEWMFSRGVDFNKDGGFGTPLHFAHALHHQSAIEFLSQKQASNVPGKFPIEDVFLIGGWHWNFDILWEINWQLASSRAPNTYPNIHCFGESYGSHERGKIIKRLEAGYRAREQD